jgi:mannitol-1-phosphate/altronate dehydrogenase
MADTIVTVITPHDIERYRNGYGAQQVIDAMHEDFHRWIRQIRARGLGHRG